MFGKALDVTVALDGGRLGSVAQNRHGCVSAVQSAIASSAGGEPGARLVHPAPMPVSGDTLLRLIRAEPVTPIIALPRL